MVFSSYINSIALHYVDLCNWLSICSLLRSVSTKRWQVEFSVTIEDLKDKAWPHKALLEIPQASVDKDIEKRQFLQASRDNSLFVRITLAEWSRSRPDCSALPWWERRRWSRYSSSMVSWWFLRTSGAQVGNIDIKSRGDFHRFTWRRVTKSYPHGFQRLTF